MANPIDLDAPEPLTVTIDRELRRFLITRLAEFYGFGWDEARTDRVMELMGGGICLTAVFEVELILYGTRKPEDYAIEPKGILDNPVNDGEGKP